MFLGGLICSLLVFNVLAEDSTGPVFLHEPPNRVDFLNTTGAVVECSARGNPPPDIIWVKSDGTAVGDVPLLRQVLANGSLVFPPFLAKDYREEVHAQIYICIAKNSEGSIHSRDVKVRAAMDQFYETNVYKAYGVHGNTVILKCDIPFFVAPFVSVISWHTDHNESFSLGESDSNSKYLVLPSGELHIKNVEIKDGHKSYQCHTKHRLTGETKLSATKGQLVIIEPIEVRAPRSSSESRIFLLDRAAGNSLALMCPVQAFPAPTFKWYNFIEGTNETKAVTLNDDRVKQVAGTLIIYKALVEDSGKYICVVSNSVGEDKVEIVLTVNAPLEAEIDPPVQTVDIGSPAVFTCKFQGNPIKTINWLKDGQPLNYTDAILHIEAARKEDKGMYQCFIRNDQESVEGTAELKLREQFSANGSVQVQGGAPPQFKDKYRNETARKGDLAVLECLATGEKPISILWNINNTHLESNGNNRYTVREEILPNGILSNLSIEHIERSDSAIYTCVATNPFGSDDAKFNMTVQGVPEVPYALEVLNKSTTTVLLSWMPPFDGNSPINKYFIEYKPNKTSWANNSKHIAIDGVSTEAVIYPLQPSTLYQIRIIAENKIGPSNPSDSVTITTAENVPSGPPTNIIVTSRNRHTLIVYWMPPDRYHWNGDILGYYIGYKFGSSDRPYLYKCVESEEKGQEHNLTIFNLSIYPEYLVFVRAFNKAGAGPPSEVIKGNNAKYIPKPEPEPEEFGCTTLTSQTIAILQIWPPLTSFNGKWYKVIYGPSDSWFDKNTTDTKIFNSTDIILHDLKKYTNYSMEVLVYTSGGVGVRTTPIHCQTNQDVPTSPSAIKALVMSADSILVSWKPPTEPNGIIEYYTVYYKEAGDSHAELPQISITYHSHHGVAQNLSSSNKYEFWVTATTIVDESQPSEKVTLSPSTTVSTKIASFNDSFSITYKEDVTLPCLAVGVPPPVVTWNIKGVKFYPKSTDRIRQQFDGSLLIHNVTRTDAGEYSCRVENDHGQDSVTHRLIVIAPPQTPIVKLTSISTNSLTVSMKPRETYEEPIHGYTIHYKLEFSDWETVQVAPNVDKYTIENLLCGAKYQLYVIACNSMGTGDPSEKLSFETQGKKPIILNAEKEKFIEISSKNITLHLDAWSDGGCPIICFVIEQKKKASTKWIRVANKVKPLKKFVLFNLDSAQRYNLRVTAHNVVGFSVAEYEFATLTLTGEILVGS